MIFSTPLFLTIFLPICLALYYLTPPRFRNFTLLCASLLFYFWGEQIFVLIMVASILIDYTHGLLVEKFKNQGKDTLAKCAVASSILFNLCLLGYFKYTNLFVETLQNFGMTGAMEFATIHLPIGISFYTFQTMSYTVDVYRGDAKAQRNIINFGAFVTLFPQLIAGPILKYKDLGAQLDARTHKLSRFVSGIEIFIIGLSKKVLLANAMGWLWEQYQQLPTNQLSVLGAWLGVLAFTFQIYFDFSGYSDMAVGLGRMLGFEFSGNFNYPYISKSITDFWRRWHISLSSWFREYLYIPLGGNRKSKGRVMFNLFLVWAATGFWHGASWNFLLWGLYFFVLLIIEREFLGKVLSKAPTFLGHCYTLFFILISWTIFAIEDFARLGEYLKVMFGFGAVPPIDERFVYYFFSYLPLLVVASIASTPFPKKQFHKLKESVQMPLGLFLMFLGLVVSLAYLVDSSYNPFLYARF
ncbi:MAG: MBOAT family O-acyltransferase [Eubacteriales bacterium]